jgi:uroporphyrinogen-III synthase
VLLTGVGTQAMFEVLTKRMPEAALVEEMNRRPVVIRGPKPAAVLNRWGVRIDLRAPEPNTWREILQALDSGPIRIRGRTIAVQEYGRPNPEFYEGLRERGAAVVPVPVYRWELPEDLAPLRAAIHGTIAGEFDVLLFTSAQQVHHVLEVAEAEGVREAWLAAAQRCFIGSIGPTATETLLELGLKPDCEPEHPKMGPLVAETLAAFRRDTPTGTPRSDSAL